MAGTQESDASSERRRVDRMLAGDEAAYDDFFADYFPRLFRFAAARLQDDAAAEDVVQATLVLAMRKIGTWRGEAALFTWLCTICRREMFARSAREGRVEIVPLTGDMAEVRAALESLGRELDAPDVALSRGDVGRLVQAALDYLPPRYSRVLSLKYLDDLSVLEIAARLETTPKAVESLLSRAREAFREAFASLQNQPGPV